MEGFKPYDYTILRARARSALRTMAVNAPFLAGSVAAAAGARRLARKNAYKRSDAEKRAHFTAASSTPAILGGGALHAAGVMGASPITSKIGHAISSAGRFGALTGGGGVMLANLASKHRNKEFKDLKLLQKAGVVGSGALQALGAGGLAGSIGRRVLGNRMPLYSLLPIVGGGTYFGYREARDIWNSRGGISRRRKRSKRATRR